MKNYIGTKTACYTGYVVQAIACSFLPLLYVIFQKNYGISYEKLGRLVLIFFATQIIVDFLSIMLVKKIGFKKTAILSQFFSFFGFSMLSFLPNIISPYTALTVSVITYGVGSGLIEVVISPIIEYLPSDNKSGNMAFLHSFFCFGNVFVVICTTVMLYFIGENNWGYIALFWAVVPLVDTVLFAFAHVEEPKESEKHIAKELFKSPVFYIMLALMLSAGASEISVSNWISAFAEQSLHITKVFADLLGPCLFAVCMGIGRVAFSIIGDKVKIKNVLLLMSFFTIVFYIVLALSQKAVISLAAGSLIGICVSVMWPGVLSFSSSKFPFGTASLFAFLAMFGDLGCSVGPWVTGIVADAKGLNAAFLVGTVFPLIMFTLMILFKDKKEIK